MGQQGACTGTSRRGPTPPGVPVSLGVCERTYRPLNPPCPAALSLQLLILCIASRPNSSEFITSSKLVNSVKRLYSSVTRSDIHRVAGRWMLRTWATPLSVIVNAPCWTW